MSAALCFVDTETSSLIKPWLPGGRRTWETAIIRRTPEGHCQSTVIYTPLDPEVVGNPANEVALAKGGYWDRSPFVRKYTPYFGPDVEVHVVPEIAAGQIIAAQCIGATIVGANPRFDEDNLHFLTYLAYGDQWAEPHWEYHTFDVTPAAAAVGGIKPPYRSADVSAAVGIDRGQFEPKHTALADARWAMAQFDATYSPGRVA